MIIIPTDAMFFLKTLTLAALLYVLTNILIRSLLSKTRHPLPPGPRGFPVVGALPLLGNMPHVALAKMAKKYGPIIYLKVGTYGMIVASTPESAKAFLKTLDTNFVNRPPNAGAKHVAYNSQDMVFGKYGARWRLLRKLSNLHMLGNKALGDWREIRVSEVGYMLDGMHEASCKRETVVLSEMLVFAISNMIGQVMFSRRIFVTRGEELNEFKDMVVELLTSAGHFNIGDFIPSIAWMDLQGIEKGMKHLHKKFDDLISKILDEHLRSTHTRIEKPDFLDVVLANRDTLDGERLSTNNVKALILNMFVAGTDTTSSTIEWAMAEMMINPIILKRAQSEMDQIVGRNRRLMESDIPNLPYLQAICKEAFRKHPSTPLNLPRVALEPCTVDGYYIPKNTRLSVNIWAIGRDPNVWENPLEFNPDRFMSGKNAKLDPTGHDFELIPFGSGRRICAGARMGVVLVEYLLGSLIHSFDWTLPEGVVEMNMDETFGMALQKAVPLAATVTARLPLNCYGP